MVSLITINYNGYKDTCELVESLCRFEDYPYEIIVVDNASPNGDGPLLKTALPGAIVICSDKNLGFSGGNNLGYLHAKGEYIVYINNDITISKPFLKILVNRMQSSGKIGAVSPKIKYEYQQDTIQYAGYVAANPIRVSYNLIGLNQKDNGQYDQAHSTGSVHGACIMTSREVLEKVGTMTEAYFLFYEELDWSWQLQRGGYETWYEPAACVLHKVSMTIKRGSPFRLYYLTRSRILFARRNYKFKNKVLALFYQMTIVIPKSILIYAISGEGAMLRSFLKGCFHGFTDTIHSKKPHDGKIK